MNIPTISEDTELNSADIVTSEGEFSILASKIEDLLTIPNVEDEVLKEAVAKLRKVDSSLTRLKSRVTGLTLENKELQEALTTLHESHETRTEASGTESELVHGKTPSIHSDLSDTESDDHSKLAKSPSIIDQSNSFQESGIFVSSCEMLNASTQTVQEAPQKCSDIPNEVMDEAMVTLTKHEYNTIVYNERKLQREIEVLQCDKEQLRLLNISLEEQIKNRKNKLLSEESQVLRAQLRHLEEKLETCERYKNEYFDEKCEMEEAENDARLLCQRLESQLEASREMESLLSASLSQEQEFCRELQQRVRELQEIDKDRRKHEAMLEKELEMIKKQHLSNQISMDDSRNEIIFALCGIIWAHYWHKIMALQNPKAIVPISYTEGNYSLRDIFSFTNEFLKSLGHNSHHRIQENLHKNSDKSKIHVHTQTQDNAADNGCRKIKNSVILSERHSSRENLEKVQDELSQREEFYLSQIDSLQRDKKRLREDFEGDHALLLDQLQNVKNERNRVQQSLEESQQEKCKLLFKLEELQIALSDFEIEKESKFQELKREFNQSLDTYHQDRRDMERRYEQQINELNEKSEGDTERFNALLQQFSVLQKELEPFLESSSSGLAELVSVDNGSKTLTTKGLLVAVRELVKIESSSREKIKDLEKKECAYRETINEADRIMSNHVTLYTQRIEDLEAKIDQKDNKINQLEKSEERLRSTVKNTWKTGESVRISELLDRLLETENSELQLKERVWNLEKNGKELQIKFVEAEKAQENLRNELRDQDELMQKIMILTTENKTLASCLEKAQQTARRSCEFQQNENFLNGRVEELEASENYLKSDLESAKQALKQKETKILNLNEEISNMRLDLEDRVSELKNEIQQCGTLRQQNEDLRNKIKNLKEELKNSSTESISHESQHRTEVTKLRSQLKLANTQLTELDSLNGELKERLSEAESALRKTLVDVDAKTQLHEKELCSLSSNLNEKEKKLDELEKQLNQENCSSMFLELDSFALSNVSSLQQVLQSVQESSKECSQCKVVFSRLRAIIESLKCANQMSSSRIVTSDSEVDEPESIETFTPPKSFCGDGPESIVDGPPSYESQPIELTNCSIGKVLPAAPPRLRRGAKQKKHKHGRSLSNKESNISSETRQSCSRDCCNSPSTLLTLQEKINTLEEDVDLRNHELHLVDNEASELQQRLLENEALLKRKIHEVNKSNEALISLQKQYNLTVQEYEKNQKTMETKNKIEKESQKKMIESLNEDVQKFSLKTSLKDKIINHLLNQIRAILRSESTVILVNQIRRIENTKPESEGETIDFDVDRVCELLQTPREAEVERKKIVLGQTARKKSLVPVSSNSARGNSGKPQLKSFSATTIKSLPPIEPCKKSRIPRLRPLTCTPLKHDGSSSQCILLSYNKHSVSSNCFEHILKTTESKHDLKFFSSKRCKKSLDNIKVSTKLKKIEKEDSPSGRYITDARKVKRMITGLVPINAEVDCSSAPEWKRQSLTSTPSCIPRPSGLKITRRVGLDGAVIAWNPIDHDCVAGFQVIVSGNIAQQVRSPHRTKALVTGLPYPGPFTISLVAVTNEGLCSVPTAVTHELSAAYKPKISNRNLSVHTSPCITPRRAVATNL